MLKARHKKVLIGLCLVAGSVALDIGFVGIAELAATEAPAGFNTPSFNGTQSVSNGIDEPSGDTFALDQEIYVRNHAAQSPIPLETELGPGL